VNLENILMLRKIKLLQHFKLTNYNKGNQTCQL
jgi:hypothetical protein